MFGTLKSRTSGDVSLGVQRHRSSPGRTGCLGWYRWYWSHDVMAWWLKFEFWKFSVRPRSKEAGGGHRQWDCCFFVLSLGYILPETTWKWMVGRVVSCCGGLFSGAILVSGRVHMHGFRIRFNWFLVCDARRFLRLQMLCVADVFFGVFQIKKHAGWMYFIWSTPSAKG